MSRWTRKVLSALKRPGVAAGIAMVFVEKIDNHLADNYGRGKSGMAETHRPLQFMYGTQWVSKPKSGDVVIGKRTVYRFARRKIKGTSDYEITPVEREEFQVQVAGRRNGGQPLHDTGAMAGSMNARGKPSANGIQITLRGLAYARYQDKGFKTKGPNFIPLTNKGKRKHGTGRNPHKEGLGENHDYMMAWGGVTVPARPFLLPTNAEMKDVGKSIYLSLKKILKGN